MANTKITAANIDSTSTGITLADLTVNGDITGTLATAAQPNITSVGTLTGLNVNVGTNNVGATFTSTDQEVLLALDDSLKTTTIESNNGILIFGTNGASGGTSATEAMRIDRNQLVTCQAGINVTGTVAADGYRTAADNTNYSLFTRNSSNTAVYIQQAGSGNILDVQSGSAGAGQGTSRLLVKSDGNVGIGTSSPAQKLDIAGTAPNIRFTDTRQITWSGSEKLGGVEWHTTDTSANGPLTGASIYCENSVGSTIPNFNMVFATQAHNNASAPVERMRIDSSGNVGIGTTSVTSPGLWYDGANDYLAISHWASPPTPSAMLHLSDNSNDLDVPQIRIEGRENAGDTRLDISVKDAAVRLNLIEGTSDASNGYGQMIFKTNAAANTGAVNRGGFKFDTPASSNSLVVTNTAGIGFGTDNPFSFGGADFEFYDASSGQTGVRITSSASSFEIGTDSNGGYFQSITPGDGMSFYTANSSAADVQAMKMNSGGIVTTPQNPAFRAYLSTEQTANGTVTSGYTDVNTTASRAYDRGGNFNISNGRFTAPVDGVYVFSVMWDSLSSQAGFNFLVNGTDYNVMWEPTGLSNDAWESKYYGTHLKLSANDYVQLTIVHASGTNPVHQGAGVWGHFAGALIG